jgi:hypothetical protein
MVAAVEKSNKEWFGKRRRARYRRTAVLILALAGLLALFPVLRTSADQTLLMKTSGTVTLLPARIPFPSAPEGYVAVVHVSLSGQTSGGATVRIVAKDQEKKQKELAQRAVAPASHGTVRAAVNFAIQTAQSASYAVIVEGPNLHYAVTVRSAPVILDVQKTGFTPPVTVDSPLIAVKLYPNQPLYLQIRFALLKEVWAARALMENEVGGQAIVESPDAGYAVLWISGINDQRYTPEVTGQFVSQGPDLYPGPQVGIQAENASISTISTQLTKVPFAVETSCQKYDGASLDLVDSGGKSVASTARSVPGGSILVPAAHGSVYSLILLSNNIGMNCRVGVRSFAQQKITTPSNRRVTIGANSRFNAYPVRLASDAAIVMANLNGAAASFDCPPNKITESDSNRLVAFAPRNHDCVLSIARPSSNLGKPASYPLLIVPVSGG